MCADADKPIVLCPGKPELVPAKPLWGFSTIEAPDAPSGLIVLADEHRALAPRAPREHHPGAVASMLRPTSPAAGDLPRGVRAEIQPEDERFAMDTIDRKVGRDGPTNSAHKTTAGIAWERVLIERVSDLVARYRQLASSRSAGNPPASASTWT